MKPLPAIRSLVLSAALVVPVFAVVPSTSSEVDAIVPLNSEAAVAHGMSRAMVEFMFGVPGARLSRDVWVYWNFKAKNVPGADAFDALVVGFTGDRVTLLRLSRSEPVKAFIAQQEARAQKIALIAQ
jgi:hypothetical protein